MATPTTAPVRRVVIELPSATSCSPAPVQITVARIAGTWSSAMPIFFTTAVPVGVWYADITSTAPSPKICRAGNTKFPAASSRNASRTASIAVLIETVRRTSSADRTLTGPRLPWVAPRGSMNDHSRSDIVQSWLDENLARLIDKHGVPAASIAVLADGEVSATAAGILNLNTGVEATTDAIFQVGSITKLWTTTLIMQLVAEGKIELDRPVRDYLPEFKLADEAAAASITPRHLLTHTAGFSGDAFTPTSRGDDAVELFVRDVLPGLAQEVPPGAGFSYNNSGFVVLGRIAEVLRGKPYHELVREHIGVPLELKRLATIPDEALLYRAALGHVRPTPDAPLQAAPVWSLVHAMAPAGRCWR